MNLISFKVASLGILRLVLETGRLWQANNALGSAGALAFYTLFSLAPILIFVITAIGVFLGPEAAETRIVDQLQGFIGEEGAQAARQVITNTRIDRAGWLPTIAGLGAMTVGATAVFAQLQRSLNAIWGVTLQPTRRGRILMVLRNRVLSLLIVGLFGLSLFTTLVTSVALRAVARFAADWLPFDIGLLTLLDTALTVSVMTVLFAAIFRILPDVRLSWRDVMPGALITAILFMPGRQLMASYLTLTAPGSAYGAAGSLVVLLLWIYGSALIVLLGAAATRAIFTARGGVILLR